MHTIRAFNFSNSDYRSMGTIVHEIWGNELEPWIENIKHCDRLHAPDQIVRYLVESDGEVVGYLSACQSIWFDSPGKYSLTIEVHPEYQKRGIGTALFDQLISKLGSQDPQILITKVTADNFAAGYFLEKPGFDQIDSEPVFALDLAAFDQTYFENINCNQEVEIISLAKLKDSHPDWLQKWWHLEWEILQDLPSEDEPVRRTLEQFSQDVQHPAIIPDGFFFAVIDGVFIGIAGVTRFDESTVEADLTWVSPEHHGKQIELMLKLSTIEFVIGQDFAFILESVEDELISELNDQLGFQQLTPWAVFEKRLNP